MVKSYSNLLLVSMALVLLHSPVLACIDYDPAEATSYKEKIDNADIVFLGRVAKSSNLTWDEHSNEMIVKFEVVKAYKGITTETEFMEIFLGGLAIKDLKAGEETVIALSEGDKDGYYKMSTIGRSSCGGTGVFRNRAAITYVNEAYPEGNIQNSPRTPGNLSIDEIVDDFMEAAFRKSARVAAYDAGGYIKHLYKRASRGPRKADLIAAGKVADPWKLIRWGETDIAISMFYSVNTPSYFTYSNDSWMEAFDRSAREDIGSIYDDIVKATGIRILFDFPTDKTPEGTKRPYYRNGETWRYPYTNFIDNLPGDIILSPNAGDFRPSGMCDPGPFANINGTWKRAKGDEDYCQRFMYAKSDRYFLTVAADNTPEKGEWSFRVAPDHRIIRMHCYSATQQYETFIRSCILWGLGLNEKWLIAGEESYHIFLLSILYDERLQAGMTVSEVGEIIPEIIRDKLARQ